MSGLWGTGSAWRETLPAFCNPHAAGSGTAVSKTRPRAWPWPLGQVRSHVAVTHSTQPTQALPCTCSAGRICSLCPWVVWKVLSHLS